MEHFSYIDKTKGLAMLFVIICHIYIFSYGNSNFDGFRLVMSMELQVFMYVSGFLMYKPESTMPYTNVWNSRLRRKIRSLLSPFFFYGILFSCFLVTKENGGGKTLLYHQIVDKFLFADIKNGYWYLWVLVIFTISERLFRLCKLKCWVQDVALALGIYTVFCFLWKTLGIYSSLMSIYMWVLYFPFFIFGYLARKYNLQKKLLSDNVFTAALVGFVCAFYLLHFSGIVYTVFNRLIVPLCGIIILQRIMVDREGRHTILDRALSFIGIHTLDVYVLHYFIVTSLNLQSIGWWGMSTSNDLLLFVLACVISLPIAYMTIAIGMIVKKSELLRKLIYG